MSNRPLLGVQRVAVPPTRPASLGQGWMMSMRHFAAAGRVDRPGSGVMRLCPRASTRGPELIGRKVPPEDLVC